MIVGMNAMMKILYNPFRINALFSGGVGVKSFGTQFQQQHRIYSASNISVCHCANLSGGSYHYVAKE